MGIIYCLLLIDLVYKMYKHMINIMKINEKIYPIIVTIVISQEEYIYSYNNLAWV